MLAFALVHAIRMVGEAAGKIPAELRDEHPQFLGRSSPVCVTGWFTRLFRYRSGYLLDNSPGIGS
jgi:hypothetical protein